MMEKNLLKIVATVCSVIKDAVDHAVECISVLLFSLMCDVISAPVNIHWFSSDTAT